MPTFNFTTRKVFLLIASLGFTVIGGCSVNKQNQVRYGEDPRYEDKDVVFRTTYYFRVFDYCRSKNKTGYDAIPATDSLYRFKMTGKANTYFNDILFESGTLKSWEIDPFGARVEYDENIGRHRYVSAEETEQSARQEKAWVDYERLKQEYLAFKNEMETNNINIGDTDKITPAIATVLQNEDAFDSAKLKNSIESIFTTLNTNNSNLVDTFASHFITSANQHLTRIKNDSNKTLKDALEARANEWLANDILAKLIAKIDNLATTFGDVDEQDETQKRNKWQLYLQTVLPANSIDYNGVDDDFLKSEGVFNVEDTELASNYAAAKDTIYSLWSNEIKNTNISLTVFDSNDENKAKRMNMLLSSYLAHHTKIKNDNGIAGADIKKQVLLTWFKKELKAHVKSMFSTFYDATLNVSDYPKVESYDKDGNDVLVNANKTNILNRFVLSQKSITTQAQQLAIANQNQLTATLNTLASAMTSKLQEATGLPSEQTKADNGLSLMVLADESIECKSVNKRKGFQILGPEGWRTFDQNERLIMAMYSDNKPITQVLKEVSEKVLDAQQNLQQDLLQLTQAELRLANAKQAMQMQRAEVVAAEQKENKNKLCQLIKSMATALDADTNELTSAGVVCDE